MYCNKCGTRIPDDSRFCPKCGNGVAPISTHLNSLNIAGKDVRDEENYSNVALKESSDASKGVGAKILITVGAVILLIIILSMAIAGTTSNKSSTASKEQNFTIEGKWKSVGDHGIGMAQPGAIVTFDGQNCNVISPMDTYAFEQNGNSFRLYVSGVMGGNVSFDVVVENYNDITLDPGTGNVTKLRRMQ